MRIDCPYDEFPDAHVVIPDAWYGEHAQRHDEAVTKARAAKLPQTWQDFSVAMALLDDWSLPGMSGNPEKWDLGKVNLRIMAWVSAVTLPEYYACFRIPKNS